MIALQGNFGCIPPPSPPLQTPKPTPMGTSTLFRMSLSYCSLGAFAGL